MITFARPHSCSPTTIARRDWSGRRELHGRATMAELAAPAGDDLQQQLESLRAEATRQQLESEQALHDLSSKLSAAEQDLSAVRDELASAKTQAEQERVRREEAERRVAQQDERRKGDLGVAEEARKKLEQCEREKRELVEAVEKEQRERASVEGASRIGPR